MPTDRDLLFEQWSFRARLAVAVLHDAAKHLALRFDLIGGIHAEQAFSTCAADVAQLVLSGDTAGLLSLGDRVTAGTYEPLVEALRGDDATQ
jgi:precorrin-2 methylase